MFSNGHRLNNSLSFDCLLWFIKIYVVRQIKNSCKNTRRLHQFLIVPPIRSYIVYHHNVLGHLTHICFGFAEILRMCVEFFVVASLSSFRRRMPLQKLLNLSAHCSHMHIHTHVHSLNVSVCYGVLCEYMYECVYFKVSVHRPTFSKCLTILIWDRQ